MSDSKARARAAATAKWAQLSPEQRRAQTEAATAASVASRQAKAAKRARRAAEQQAATDRAVLAAVQPDTVAEARRILGPNPTDADLVRQVLLVIKARRAAGFANPNPER